MNSNTHEHWTKRDDGVWVCSAPGEDWDGMTLTETEADIWALLYMAGPHRGDPEAKERALALYREAGYKV